VESLRAVLMVKMGNEDQVEATSEESEKLKEFARRFSAKQLLDAIHAFDHASQHTNIGWQPGLQLELAVSQVINQKGMQKKDQSEIPAEKNHLPQKEPKVEEAVSRAPVRVPVSASHTPSLEKRENRPEERKENKIVETIIGESKSTADLKSTWPDIRSVAKDISPETAALLNSCKSFEMKNGCLVLGFSSSLLRDKMEAGQNLENARLALKRIIGEDIPIECRIAGKAETIIPEGMDIDHGGMIGAALRLGGKIIKEEKKS
jgi:DNA polymerase-3 subunit gamma/tau